MGRSAEVNWGHGGVLGFHLIPLTHVRGSVYQGYQWVFRGDVAFFKIRRVGGAVDVEAVVALVQSLAGFSLILSDLGEEFDGTVKAAGEMCVVAREFDDRLRAAEHGIAEQLAVNFAAGLDALGLDLLVKAAGLVDVGGDDGRLDAGDALHPPLRVGDLETDLAL